MKAGPPRLPRPGLPPGRASSCEKELERPRRAPAAAPCFRGPGQFLSKSEEKLDSPVAHRPAGPKSTVRRRRRFTWKQARPTAPASTCAATWKSWNLPLGLISAGGVELAAPAAGRTISATWAWPTPVHAGQAGRPAAGRSRAATTPTPPWPWCCPTRPCSCPCSTACPRDEVPDYNVTMGLSFQSHATIQPGRFAV